MKQKPVQLGIESLRENPEPIRRKRVAVLSHQAAVNHELQRTVDVVQEIVRDDFVRIFGPEHGFWGVKQDMEGAGGEIDRNTRREIFSLYVDYPKRPGQEGEAAWRRELCERKHQLWPKRELLEDVDALVVDLQDVGARYYTFANTLAYCMEVAKQTGTKVVVCDRPNPINGVDVEGNLFDDPRWYSFVGQFNITPRHGMTIGELARFFQTFDDKYRCNLEVIPMRGWEREMWWDDTDLPWVPPSPNMPALATATVYPGMCLIEATEASEGRGTTTPFELFGAPGVDPFELALRLESVKLQGIRFRPQFFQPTFQKHGPVCTNGSLKPAQVCGGVQLHVTDRNVLQSYRTGLWCVKSIHDIWGDFAWRRDAYEYEPPKVKHALEQLVGSVRFRDILADGGDIDEWAASWDNAEFLGQREEVLLYR